MGHGAPRELGTTQGAKKPLEEDDSQRLEAALQKFENKDPQFKTSREDERHQQMSKAWVSQCNAIVENLRSIGQAVVNQHQVLLDMGQDGAGVGAAPWIEEASLKFERLHIRLKGEKVVAEVGMSTLAEAPNMAAADYDWLEKAVVAWLVHEASTK